ncbi:hypothetical protein CRUP_033847, partial [Coryphaenoides rupestris]
MLNAEVVCNSVQCGTAMQVKQRAFYGEGKGRIWMDDVRCTGKEASLADCERRDFGSHNCGHGEDVGVICSEHLKLVNGTQRCAGRVQVRRGGGQWRNVCKSHMSVKEQEVICRELNCGVPLVGPDLIDFGDQSAPIGINLNCLGNETSIMQCGVKETEET